MGNTDKQNTSIPPHDNHRARSTDAIIEIASVAGSVPVVSMWMMRSVTGFRPSASPPGRRATYSIVSTKAQPSASEKFDGRLIDRAIPVADADEADRFRKMFHALTRLMDARGFEADWPRGLHGRLKAAGLVEVGMEGHLAVREGGSPGAGLDAVNFAQVRGEAVARGLISDPEVEAVLNLVAAPDFAVFSPVMFTAWGRRP